MIDMSSPSASAPHRNYRRSRESISLLAVDRAADRCRGMDTKSGQAIDTKSIHAMGQQNNTL